MELDTRRKLIIGALDPRHTELARGRVHRRQRRARSPTRAARAASTSSPTPTRRTCGRSATSSRCRPGHTSSCIQDCRYIWTGGPARRGEQRRRRSCTRAQVARPDPRPASATRTRLSRSSATAGRSGSPTCATRHEPKVSDQPVDLWRNDGYTDYSHDVDEDDQGIAWVSGRGGVRGYATSGRHRDPYQNRVRRATPFDPVLVAGGGVAGTAQPVMLMHNSGRPTDGSVKRVRRSRRATSSSAPRRSSRRPCERERQDRPLRPHRLVGRRARAALDARGAVPDEGAGHVPSVHRHAGDREPGRRLLGALLRDRGADAGRRLVRPGPAPDRHLERARRAPGRLLPRHRHRHGQPVLELVGHRVPHRPHARATSSTCST